MPLLLAAGTFEGGIGSDLAHAAGLGDAADGGRRGSREFRKAWDLPERVTRDRRRAGRGAGKRVSGKRAGRRGPARQGDDRPAKGIVPQKKSASASPRARGLRRRKRILLVRAVPAGGCARVGCCGHRSCREGWSGKVRPDGTADITARDASSQGPAAVLLLACRAAARASSWAKAPKAGRRQAACARMRACATPASASPAGPVPPACAARGGPPGRPLLGNPLARPACEGAVG